MKNNKIKNNFSLKDVISITFSFCLLSIILTGLFFYYKNNQNLLLDKNALNIVSTFNKIVNDYYGKVDKEELAASAIDSMLNSLNEEYSIYMDSDYASSLNNSIDGHYEGIGVLVTRQDKEVVILQVYDNTPAKEVGLQNGDILISIDDYIIKEDDELTIISKKITENNSVNLVVKRNGKEMEFKLDIKKIAIPVVTSKVFIKNDKTIGYIYLSSFSSNAKEQVKYALEELEKKEINALIFDVRGNVGGYLKAADEILNLFVKNGKILYTIEDNKGKKNYYSTNEDNRNYDIVVLIDGRTASAAEILATSLKENNGAILVGKKTYGKGLIQQLSSFSNNTMIKYTTAKWYTPEGNYINEIGYNPSIDVDLTKEYVNNPCDDTDNQLQKAIEILSK